MGLRLRHVPPMQGSQWLRQAWSHYLKQPLGFSLLFLAYLLMASVIGAVPFIGSLLSLATVPLLSLAFMLATQDVIQGRRVRLGHLFAVARQPKKQRLTSLLLCLAFGFAVVVIIEIGVRLGGSELSEALKPLGAKEGGDAKQLMALLSHPAVGRLANTIWFLAALLSVPFWHALARTGAGRRRRRRCSRARWRCGVPRVPSSSTAWAGSAWWCWPACWPASASACSPPPSAAPRSRWPSAP
jgi:hypothetical protein